MDPPVVAELSVLVPGVLVVAGVELAVEADTISIVQLLLSRRKKKMMRSYFVRGVVVSLIVDGTAVVD